MRLIERIKGLFVAKERGERDAPAMNAGPRESGGGSDADTQDRHSSTRTTEHGPHVGRAGGDEAGDSGTSGAERRSGQRAEGGDGAARDT